MSTEEKEEATESESVPKFQFNCTAKECTNNNQQDGCKLELVVVGTCGKCEQWDVAAEMLSLFKGSNQATATPAEDAPASE